MTQTRAHAEAIAKTLAKTSVPRSHTPPTPRQTRILQTYRHILREVSYLPPAIRQHIHEPIVRRFHRARKPGKHDKHRFQRAQNVLRTLRAAHAGDKKVYLNLIQRAFGRVWVRWHQLMEDYFRKVGPKNSSELEAALNEQAGKDDALSAAAPADAVSTKGQTDTAKPSDNAAAAAARTHDLATKRTGTSKDEGGGQAKKEPKPRGFQRFDLDKLMSAMLSQKGQEGPHIPTWPLNAIGDMSMRRIVPATNTWGKPPVASLALTKEEKWWNSKIIRVAPPVPKAEWDVLQRLANGLQNEDEAWKLPCRRVSAQQVEGGDHGKGDEAWDWSIYARKSITRIESEQSARLQRASGKQPAGPFGLVVERQAPSPRWFRRAYKQTWMVTPYAQEDPTTSKPTFKWGEQKVLFREPSALQMSIFDGVDGEGKIPKKPKSRGVPQTPSS